MPSFSAISEVGLFSVLELSQPVRKYWSIGVTCSVRDGDWKLVHYYDSGEKELFNIREDIGERRNLANDHPGLVKRLSKELGNICGRSADNARLLRAPESLARGRMRYDGKIAKYG